MTKVWVLYGEKLEDRFVLGVYSSLELAKKYWLEYYKTNNPYISIDEIWWVDDDKKRAIQEFEVKEK